MLIYSLLHLTGYDLPISELKTSASCTPKPGSPGSRLHRRRGNHHRSAGPVSLTRSGWLSPRKPAAQFNRPGHDIVDHYTYAFMGDGCMMEGISHEVCSWPVP